MATASRARRARRARRTWPQRTLIAFNIFLIFSCLVSAAGLGYFYVKFGELPRIDLDEVLDPEEEPGDPQNILVVGSDNARGLPEDDPVLSGRDEVGGERSDTMMILRIDPRTKGASLLSVPRDLWVTIADVGHKQRINTAFNDGGADRLIATIQDNLGIQIHHYVQIDFAGFRDLVQAVDGVPVYFPAPARDVNSGLRIEQAGCVMLDGFQALAFVRARNYREYESGRWRTDPSGDIGRIARQQAFIRRSLRRAVSAGVRNPVKLNQLLDVGIDNVKVDSALSASDIFGLARRFRDVEPDTVNMYTLPTTDANIGGAAVLLLNDEKAQPILDIFRGVAPTTAEEVPSSVRVRVLNGTGTSGQAAQVAEALVAVGFNLGPNTAADADSFDYARTTIRYAPGKQGAADLVRRHLQAGAKVEAADTVNSADVVVITGRDFSGVLTTPVASDGPVPGAAPTTTTTLPSSVRGVAPRGDPAEERCG